MKRTNPAVDLAGMASSARSCAPVGFAAMPADTPANRLFINKRNGFMGTTTGVPARRQRSLTT